MGRLIDACLKRMSTRFVSSAATLTHQREYQSQKIKLTLSPALTAETGASIPTPPTPTTSPLRPPTSSLAPLSPLPASSFACATLVALLFLPKILNFPAGTGGGDI